MKKIILLGFLFLFTGLFSQCNIIGPDQIQVGERQQYFAEHASADCTDCYHWFYMDQKVILEGDTRANPLTLKGAVPGKAILSLEVKTAAETLKCKKTIQVIAPTTDMLDINAQKCNIEIEAFKEIRVSDSEVMFEPITSDNKYSYQWTVTYRNGSKKMVNEKLGKFNFSNENVIDTVELSISDKACNKKLSKSYNSNFWYFF